MPERPTYGLDLVKAMPASWTDRQRWAELVRHYDRLVEKNPMTTTSCPDCERHRRMNLVRAVIDGWDEDLDGSLVEYVNAEGWDAVPWKVAARMADDLRTAQKDPDVPDA